MRKEIVNDSPDKPYRFHRSNHLLMKKFRQYLLPTMITIAAMNVNEFVDSIVASRLMGSQGMAVVGLGAPVMLAVAVVFCLLGCGGSTIYAISLGKRDHVSAGHSFTASMLTGACVGLLMMLLGMIFLKDLSGFLCKDPVIKPVFEHYLWVLLLSVPLLVTILTFVEFLPPAGLPGYCTAVNIMANVVNLLMDYVYIRIFGMSVEGAAWATLTGYMSCLLIIIYALVRKKLTLYISKNMIASMKHLTDIFKQGSSEAMSQLGFTLQLAVCNGMAQKMAGVHAVVAYSLCQQSLSMISIFICALIGASTPLLAVLHGQRDYRGQSILLKIVLWSQFIVAVLCTSSFIIFAPQAASLYNITEAAEATLAIRALRIFSLCYLVRSATIVYFRYLKIIGMTGYATLISALDGYLGIIPVVLIMCRLAGVDGIWWAYPVNAGLVMIFLLLCNRRIQARSDGRLRGILLLERDMEVRPVMDLTITRDPKDIAGISGTLQKVCDENDIDSSKAMRAALAVEEMAVFASNHKRQDSYMDVLVRLYEGKVEIDFRSLGPPIDVMEEEEKDLEWNVRMLRSVVSDIETEYIMGMNATRIIIAR